ncbi:MAG TPA: hypothetical protein VFU02_10535, partial [Polyangiaceae bacterium]|nr:hypothetical protein [Polyangiaceae bacterium]
GALLLSFVAAFGVAVLIYERYVAFERRAARHLVAGAWLAVRADLEKIVLYAPFRDEVLPLVQGPAGDPRLKPRLSRLSQHTGVELGVDVREIVYSRGERRGSWALAVGGMFPKTGIVRGIHAVLVEEGHQLEFDDRAERLHLPSGVVVQQAADSVVVLASDQDALASALAPSDRYQALELGLGEPALSLAFLGHHSPEGVGRSDAAPGAASVRLKASLAAEEPDTLRLTLQQSSVEAARQAAALVAKVTGLPQDSIQFKVEGPSQRVATVSVTGAHLSRAAEYWVTTLRSAAFPGR